MPPVETLAFLLGAALLVVAAIGGDVTVWNVRVPKLPIVPRVLCGLLGGVLLLAGPLSFLPGARPPTPEICGSLPPNPSPPNVPAVEITDRLGERQEFERVDITIGSRLVGTLCVEEGRERDSIRVPLTGGEAAWSATGSEAGRLRGQRRVRSIQGTGRIDLREPASYSVRIVADGSSDSVQTIWLRRN